MMYYTTFAVLYCCKTWTLIVPDEAQLDQVEHRMITMCGAKLVDRLSTDVLPDKGGVGRGGSGKPVYNRTLKVSY